MPREIKRLPRSYCPEALSVGAHIELPPETVRHLVHVLRLSVGEQAELFNGDGYSYQGSLSHATKRRASMMIEARHAPSNECPVPLHLGQGLCQNPRMDFAIQKAVELGVTAITPLICQRSQHTSKQSTRHAHWQQVAIAACQQSGRNSIPTILPIQRLSDWLAQQTTQQQLLCSPTANQPLSSLTLQPKPTRILVGPEGGLAQEELDEAEQQHGFLSGHLGPRILRTETAGMVAITLILSQIGDL